jgi:flagellar motor switch protein FliN/FliY
MAKKKVAPPTAAPDHLRDVMMKVTIELARTRMTLDEALALEESSVVKLDRLAGEPVDVRVNGRLFARGEVVAAAERYGVRLEIIDASVNPDDASAAERDGDG